MNDLTMQEDFELEKAREYANEENDGRRDTWIHENHSSLVNEFVEEKCDEFREYCEMRFKEAHE